MLRKDDATIRHDLGGVADAVNRRYPTMFETGSGGVGALVLEMRNDGGTEPEMWRLYRVTGQLTPGG